MSNLVQFIPGLFIRNTFECEICREKVGKYKKLLSSISKQIPYINPSEIILQLKNCVTLAVSRNKRLSIFSSITYDKLL